MPLGHDVHPRGVFRADAGDGAMTFVIFDRHGRRRLRLEVAATDADRWRRVLLTWCDGYLDVVDPDIRLVI